MAKALVIVESPAKAKTINKYLGKQFVVKASLGHIKDLPKKDLAVDVENGFRPKYEVIEGKKKLMQELQDAAKKVDSVYLAADPDREGEAICWHLQEELKRQKAKAKRRRRRRPEVLPRDVQRDHQEVDREGLREAGPGQHQPGRCPAGAPRARPPRRLQDLSAALGQSPPRPLRRPRPDRRRARHRGTRTRNPRVRQSRNTGRSTPTLAAKKNPYFDARLFRKGEDSPEIPDQAAADALVADLEGAKFIVKSVGTKEKRRNPVAPFITSTLQQESSRKLRFSVKRTMMLAQQLYEGVELGSEGAVGLITYMRTDSTRVSDDAVTEARELIGTKFGPQVHPGSAQRLQIEEGRAGRSRSRSPQLRHAHARRRRQIPRRRPAQALPPDLDALRRLADEPGRLRPDHHRHQCHRAAAALDTSSAPPAR